MSTTVQMGLFHRVISRRQAGPHAFILRFERLYIHFEAGQFLNVGVAGDHNIREYSIYSGVDDPWLEILVREVEGGVVSRRLAKLEAGDQVQVEGPFGQFTPEPGSLLLVASGSGIAPFHAMVRSNRNLEYTLLHGIRHDEECYDSGEYQAEHYHPCVSRGKKAAFRGRVTDWLAAHPTVPDPQCTCYLSGNSDMIYEVFQILSGRGFPIDRIKAEVYF